ncbi:aspartic peptidase domain-containing protein [Hygrophoropsis aurantiaca]|uniref:Aspartic peptidase domain-containing protein n=1 Tax=Hygrophoropsis aurantiaca TaxID=72124 RepID=A0ACB8ALH8_9AGAM|nr:aspartic peptidase domain-containing protein [Hygrophoropsis aurantiaca]
MRFVPCVLPLGLALLEGAQAIHLELRGRPGPSRAVQRRGHITGNTQGATLGDQQDIHYVTNITMNNVPVTVAIDTGSSDLFIQTVIPGAIGQGYNATVTYASGDATGEVKAGNLTFAGFTVSNQVFIAAVGDTTSTGADGLIGLGPSSGSVIKAEGVTSAADPPLDRIFRENPSMPNYMTVLLGRSDDPDEPYPGDLTIGETIDNFTPILNQPKHAVTYTNVLGNQHWQTLLDANGIIGPDGKVIPLKSSVTNTTTPNNPTVVFDTGFTLPQVPASVAQGLYGGIKGAALQNVSGVGEIWVLPCDEEVNATFLFAGVQFPIHPLDLNFLAGDNFCVGAFQPFSFDPTDGGVVLYDMILGMAFLRNAYLLIDFGSFVDGSSTSTNAPYLQLYPVTNATEASEDFAQQRSNSSASLSSDLLSTSKSSGKSTSNSSAKKLAAWVIGIIVGGVILVLLAIGLCFYCCCCRRRTKSAAFVPATPAWAPAYGSESYRPLNEPSPEGAPDMRMAQGGGIAPTYSEQQYKTAWDHNY